MKRFGGVVKNASARLGGAVAGYIRVSSASQDHTSQRHAIELAARARGEAIDRWFADTTSGATMDRPELAKLWRELEAKRIARVWVWRLDRLSRAGALATMQAVEKIRQSGATLASVADPFALDGPAADLIMMLVAWCNEQERIKIRENQAAARARLEASGRSWGRPPLPPHKRDAVLALQSQGKSIREIARGAEVSKTYAARVLEEFGLKAAAEKRPRRVV